MLFRGTHISDLLFRAATFAFQRHIFQMDNLFFRAATFAFQGHLYFRWTTFSSEQQPLLFRDTHISDGRPSLQSSNLCFSGTQMVTVSSEQQPLLFQDTRISDGWPFLQSSNLCFNGKVLLSFIPLQRRDIIPNHPLCTRLHKLLMEPFHQCP